MKYIKFCLNFTALILFALLTIFFARWFLIAANADEPSWLAISACGLGFFVFLIATINTLFEKAN